jgi:hypothetical protein
MPVFLPDNQIQLPSFNNDAIKSDKKLQVQKNSIYRKIIKIIPFFKYCWQTIQPVRAGIIRPLIIDRFI